MAVTAFRKRQFYWLSLNTLCEKVLAFFRVRNDDLIDYGCAMWRKLVRTIKIDIIILSFLFFFHCPFTKKIIGQIPNEDLKNIFRHPQGPYWYNNTTRKYLKESFKPIRHTPLWRLTVWSMTYECIFGTDSACTSVTVTNRTRRFRSMRHIIYKYECQTKFLIL